MQNSRNNKMKPSPPAKTIASAKMPSYVKESILRQYKGGPDYTIEDKKNVINWNLKKV